VLSGHRTDVSMSSAARRTTLRKTRLRAVSD
jgi:hypothetical protein